MNYILPPPMFRGPHLGLVVFHRRRFTIFGNRWYLGPGRYHLRRLAPKIRSLNTAHNWRLRGVGNCSFAALHYTPFRVRDIQSQRFNAMGV